jgi:serine/threonine protein kinase
VPDSGQEAASGVDLEELRMLERVHARLFGSADAAVQAIGRFGVLDKLGSGGLGTVYAAHDPRLDRRVALKVLKPGVGPRGEDVAARLLHEAQAMARLTHPNVVVVYEAGRAGDELYIAMELVDGVTLNRWAAQRERSWVEIRDVVVDAGRGLAAAHRVGLVHRDFKPSNVLVAADGRAKVVDFGLARSLQDGAGDTGFCGTPPYMAPELWRGGAVDARADQWALCVTLYELCYGTRPFTGADLSALRTAVLSGDPVSRPAGTKVPRWLHDVIARGLRLDPGDRHHDMDELLHALLRDRRSRRRAWIGAAVVAVVVVSTGWISTALERARVEE